VHTSENAESGDEADSSRADDNHSVENDRREEMIDTENDEENSQKAEVKGSDFAVAENKICFCGRNK
jgi:hypothetical protein